MADAGVDQNQISNDQDIETQNAKQLTVAPQQPIINAENNAGNNAEQINSASTNNPTSSNGQVTTTLFEMMQQQMLQQQKMQQEMMQQQMQMMQETHKKLMNTTAENTLLRQQLSDQSGTKRTLKNTPKPDRPIVDEDMPETEWEVFKDSWERYKAMCAIEDVDVIRNELRLTCSSPVNKRLIELHGVEHLKTISEEILLIYMKDVSVSSKHYQVHRQEFCRIIQKEGEAVSQYVAKIKAQADLCQYKVKCSCGGEVSYRDDMVASQTINGLTNPQFQARILEEAPDFESFKQLYERLVAFEATQRSSGIMQSSRSSPASQVNQVKSDYRKNKAAEQRNKPKLPPNPPAKDQNPKKVCPGCGENSHTGKQELKRADCPSKGKKCNKCGIWGHFGKVCKRAGSTSNAATEEHAEDEDAYLNAAMFALACNGEDQDFRLVPHQENRK